MLTALEKTHRTVSGCHLMEKRNSQSQYFLAHQQTGNAFLRRCIPQSFCLRSRPRDRLTERKGLAPGGAQMTTTLKLIGVQASRLSAVRNLHQLLQSPGGGGSSTTTVGGGLAPGCQAAGRWPGRHSSGSSTLGGAPGGHCRTTAACLKNRAHR